VPDGVSGGAHAPSSITTRVGSGTATSVGLTYDKAGNTLSTPLPGGGTAQVAWDALGRVASLTQPGQDGQQGQGAQGASTSHVYDADGGLLIRRDASGTKTLYLGGDTEVTYTPGSGTTPASTTGVRVYTFDGQVAAYRTGPDDADVVFQPPGYQGTPLVQTDGAGGSFSTRRMDPFGNPRGTPQGAGWVLAGPPHLARYV
jgi:YD repeat-containing protein